LLHDLHLCLILNVSVVLSLQAQDVFLLFHYYCMYYISLVGSQFIIKDMLEH